jgi:hypothetical protein
LQAINKECPADSGREENRKQCNAPTMSTQTHDDIRVLRRANYTCSARTWRAMRPRLWCRSDTICRRFDHGSPENLLKFDERLRLGWREDRLRLDADRGHGRAARTARGRQQIVGCAAGKAEAALQRRATTDAEPRSLWIAPVALRAFVKAKHRPYR